MSEKVIIYGAGGTGIKIKRKVQGQYDVLAFIDSDVTKQGTIIDGVKCISLDQIGEYAFDKIIIGATSGHSEMIENLKNIGISSDKIIENYTIDKVHARETFLRDYAGMCRWQYDADVCAAEAGVFRGEYARVINECFPNHKLHLYDTFEGFDDKDITEQELSSDLYKDKDDMKGHFAGTSVELVLSRMSHPNSCVIHKGYFPDTFAENDTTFGFASLDMDLYKPMKSGIETFYPRLIGGYHAAR